MPGHDIIVIGASAGGVEALRGLVSGLPADLPAAVFVVVHIPPDSTSVLPQILARAGPLPAAHARDRWRIEHGRVYVAPPDHHLLVKRGHVRVVRGPRENGHRPAVDPLFRTAAAAYGSRVVGVVLSGTLDDGAAGLAAVKARGGCAAVQDPEEALYPGMPLSAIEYVAVDQVAPLADLPAILTRLAATPAEHGEAPPTGQLEMEADMAEMGPATMESYQRPGTPSGFTCPECHGAIWELDDSEMIRFRCRIGHAFSPESLIAEQTKSLETALWIALRALQETAALRHKLADRMDQRGQASIAERFRGHARDAERQAGVIRQVLVADDDQLGVRSNGSGGSTDPRHADSPGSTGEP